MTFLLQTNWYLFAYSRFAYFRPKSGILPTHTKLHLGIKVMSKQHPEVGLSLNIYSGHDFLMAEDGQGEDRPIIFIIEVNIKLLCEAKPSMLMAPSKPAPDFHNPCF